MINKRKNTIYGNCKVYSPDGQLMFLCLEKRANWYLSRNLAEVIKKEPLEIKLNFVPGGTGNSNDEYYLSSKKNMCVVCGETEIEILTKHHIVPIEYRKHFPEVLKSRSSHDVVVICQEHHYEYENNFAQKRKRELEIFYDISEPKLSTDKKRTYKAYCLANLLMDTEKVHKIPEERIILMTNEIKDVFGHDDLYEITKHNINEIIENENLIIGKQIVDKIQNFETFIKGWRQHFIHSMSPLYMPDGWSVNNPIKV